ncbi:MAG: hypothetical protein JJU29_23770 [Verrucomicrobia bacterium]|nr:hypothetical protein [Verrucomicrobiota bacterium]
MPNNTKHTFPPEVVEKLQNYVYRLIDPRNGETFYIGKGKGNRIFSHVKGEADQDEVNEKINRIREIRISGFEVAHVIHRHGMNEKTASVVETALIDAYPGLSNIMNGHGSGDFGVMHADEIIHRYCAEEAVFKHKALLISINRSAGQKSLYDATRYAWRLDVKRARKAEVILPVKNGLIVGAFIAHEWMEATPEIFPDTDHDGRRFGFVGQTASDAYQKEYAGKRIPDRYRKPGAANPIKYTW